MVSGLPANLEAYAPLIFQLGGGVKSCLAGAQVGLKL